MTKQEYFDLLVQSASDGTFPSITIKGDVRDNCRYRADGTANCKQRCAVGLLIPDEMYDPTLEGMSAYKLYHHLESLPIPDGLKLRDLFRIQQAHDSMALVGWDEEEFLEVISDLDCFLGVDKSSLQRV